MQLLNYTVPVLKTNTSYGEFIEFQVFNSDKQKFDRHRIRLQKIRQLYTNKRQYVNIVNTMMMQLNLKLANGWNPGHDNLEDRLFTPICTALDRYTEDRAKELRPMTGKGISNEKNPNEYYATKSGKIEYDGDNKLSIVEVYEVNGDCDLADNPIIDFNGDVVINKCQNIQIQHINVTFNLQDIFFP